MPTITVTSLSNSGAGTLRQAIISAVANDTINFAVTGEIILTSGQLTIGKNLTITAPGIDQLIVSSNGTGRVMEITTGVVHMTGLYMRHGIAATGGGLVNSGMTTMTDCKVSNNTATGKGGGIWNDGTLTLNNVLVQANESSDHGGGIYNSGTLTLGSLTDLTTNVAHGANHDGGGIYNDFGTVTLTEATLDRNTATRNGGAFYNSGTVYLIRSTVSVNQSASGAIYNYLGTIYHRNSTISDNIGGVGTNDLGSAYFVQCTVVGNGDGWNNGTGTTEVGNSIFVDNGSTDLYGLDPATSNGHNIIGTFNDNFTPDGSDITGTSLADLKIGDLDDNGGPTLTRKLLTNSPAIDAGDNALPPYATDQRGTGFARILNSTVDIGAYESAVVVPPPPPPPPPPITNPGEVCVTEGTYREVLYDPTPAQIAAVQAALNARAVAYAQGLAFSQCPTPVNPCDFDSNLPPPATLVDPNGDLPAFDDQTLLYDGTEVIWTGLTPGIYEVRYGRDDLLIAREKIKANYDFNGASVSYTGFVKTNTTGTPLTALAPVFGNPFAYLPDGQAPYTGGVRAQLTGNNGYLYSQVRCDGFGWAGSWKCGNSGFPGPVGCGFAISSCGGAFPQNVCFVSADDDAFENAAINAPTIMLFVATFDAAPQTLRLRAVNDAPGFVFEAGSFTVQLVKTGNYINDYQGNPLPPRVRIRNYASVVGSALVCDECDSAPTGTPEWDGTFPFALGLDNAPLYLPAPQSTPVLSIGGKRLTVWTGSGNETAVQSSLQFFGFNNLFPAYWLLRLFCGTSSLKTLWQGKKLGGISPRGNYIRLAGVNQVTCAGLPDSICLELYDAPSTNSVCPPCVGDNTSLGIFQPSVTKLSELIWYDAAFGSSTPTTNPTVSGCDGTNLNQMVGGDGWYDATFGGTMCVVSDFLCTHPGQTLTVTFTVTSNGPNFLWFGTVDYGGQARGLDIDHPTAVAGVHSYSFPITACTNSTMLINSGATDCYVTVHFELS